MLGHGHDTWRKIARMPKQPQVKMEGRVRATALKELTKKTLRIEVTPDEMATRLTVNAKYFTCKIARMPKQPQVKMEGRVRATALKELTKKTLRIEVTPDEMATRLMVNAKYFTCNPMRCLSSGPTTSMRSCQTIPTHGMKHRPDQLGDER